MHVANAFAKQVDMSSEAPSTLDRLEQSAKIISLIFVPLIVAFFGYIVQDIVSKRDAAHKQEQTTREYVKLAKEILTGGDKEIPPELTRWAWQLLNDNAPTKIDAKDLTALIKKEERLPITSSQASFYSLGDGRISRETLEKIFGRSGNRDNLARFNFPFPMKLAWDKTQIINSTLVHKKALPYFEKAFSLIHERGLSKDAELFGGVFSNLAIRGTSKPSLHSWGIEIDIDPDNNRLRWGPDQWKMNPRVANAFIEAGFRWRGADFAFDAMSFHLSYETIKEIAKKDGISLE